MLPVKLWAHDPSTVHPRALERGVTPPKGFWGLSPAWPRARPALALSACGEFRLTPFSSLSPNHLCRDQDPPPFLARPTSNPSDHFTHLHCPHPHRRGPRGAATAPSSHPHPTSRSIPHATTRGSLLTPNRSGPPRLGDHRAGNHSWQVRKGAKSARAAASAPASSPRPFTRRLRLPRCTGGGAHTCASTRRVAAPPFPTPALLPERLRLLGAEAAGPRNKGHLRTRSRRPTSARAPHGPERPLPRSATCTRPTCAQRPSEGRARCPRRPRRSPHFPRPPGPAPPAPYSAPSRPQPALPASGGALPGPLRPPAAQRPGNARPTSPPAPPQAPARPRPPPAYHRPGRASRPRLRRNPSPQPPRRWEALAGSTFPVFLWR